MKITPDVKMASIGRSTLALCKRSVSRRTFTTGKVLRHFPPGIPNDTLPFLNNTEKVRKVPFTICFYLFISSGLIWPQLYVREEAIHIGHAVTAAQADPADEIE